MQFTDDSATPDRRPDRLRAFGQRRGEIALIAVFAISILLIHLLASPALRPVPGRDQGVFLYIGRELNRGAALYQDLWDHKPPLIHYLNALGVTLDGGSMWGIWIIEALFLVGTVALSVITLRRAFGLGAAAFGTLCWIAAATTLLSGNLLEEYALLFQFAALYFFVRMLDGEPRTLFGYFAGAAIGLTFLLRPNLIGTGLLIGLILLIQTRRRDAFADVRLMTLVIGFLAVVLVTIVYFALQGTLDSLWEVALTYNVLYSRSPWGDRLRVLRYGLDLLADTGVQIVIVGAWVFALAGVAAARRRLNSLHPLVFVGLIDLPFEWLMASLSGRLYRHYFLALLPAAAILTAFFASRVLSAVRSRQTADGSPAPVRVGLAALMIGVALLPGIRLVERLQAATAAPGSSAMQRLVEFVKTETAPDDYVLVWGAWPTVNYLADRRAPSRFIYQAPLYMPGYQSAALYDAFVAELTQRPPALILDSSGTDRGIPPIDPAKRQAWLDSFDQLPIPESERDAIYIPPEMDIVFDYLTRRYEIIGQFGGWDIYRPAS